jgi:hypothetical protein
MQRKIEPSFIADILTESCLSNAIPKRRLEFMRDFSHGMTLKEIADKHQKSPSHIYIEIARGIEDRRIYQSITEVADFTMSCHLRNLNNAMHYFHGIGASKSCADIRRAIRSLVEAVSFKT